jgi:uncharacterized protein involved in type VI secretion and phage assembly
MSVARLQNEMRKQALLAMAEIGHPKYGLITAWQLNPFSVKVTLQPEGEETGWIPYKTVWSGPGWGMVATPVQGGQVLVLFQEGHHEAGVAIGGLFSDADKPPQITADPAGGEFFLVHAKGQTVQMTNDGAVKILGSGGQTLAMDADGNITSTGSWKHTGIFKATGDVVGNCDSSPISLTKHTHGLAGGPQTTAPLPE